MIGIVQGLIAMCKYRRRRSLVSPVMLEIHALCLVRAQQGCVSLHRLLATWPIRCCMLRVQAWSSCCLLACRLSHSSSFANATAAPPTPLPGTPSSPWQPFSRSKDTSDPVICYPSGVVLHVQQPSAVLLSSTGTCHPHDQPLCECSPSRHAATRRRCMHARHGLLGLLRFALERQV